MATSQLTWNSQGQRRWLGIGTFIVLLTVLGAWIGLRGSDPSIYRGQVVLQINATQTGDDLDAYVAVEMAAMTSKRTLEEVISALGLATRWRLSDSETRKRLEESLSLKHEPGSHTIALVCVCEDEGLAGEIANAVATSYRDWRLAQGKQRANMALHTLERQLEEQAAKVEAARLRMLDLAEAIPAQDLRILNKALPEAPKPEK